MLKEKLKKYSDTIYQDYHKSYSPAALLGVSALYKIDHLIFGVNVDQFYKMKFYKMTIFQKSKYLTERFDCKFTDTIDDREKRGRWGNKANMYKYLGAFLNRDQFDLSVGTLEEFKTFAAKHPSFIYKPYKLDSGIGIRKIDTGNVSPEELYDELKKDPGVLDELVIQHEKMNELCKESVNTIRIFTIRFKDEVHFIGSSLRIGNGTAVIDNYSSGGFVCALNLDTGTTLGDAVNKYGEDVAYHPVTNTKFGGFQIPMWDEVKAFVTEMAQSIDLYYVAWDIAISKDGPVLIEANPHGGINIIQVGGAGGRKKQYKKLYKRWLKESKNV